MNKSNKKGIIDWALILGIISFVVLLAVIGLLKTLDAEATSVSSPTTGCKAPQLNAEVVGDFIVVDGAVVGIEPEVNRINNIGIRANPLAAFESFNYEVELLDSKTGVKLDSYKNSAKLSSEEKELKLPFITNFEIKDMNCDGKVDDTRLTVKITTIETEDVFKDTSVLSADYNVRNGVIVR